MDAITMDSIARDSFTGDLITQGDSIKLPPFSGLLT
jgi:hypothetical protein